MTRLSPVDLVALTGKTKKSAQVRWFESNFCSVPVDSIGVIITAAAFEALLARKLGLKDSDQSNETRPSVRPVVRSRHES
jgi:hypothetical protein